MMEAMGKAKEDIGEENDLNIFMDTIHVTSNGMRPSYHNIRKEVK